MTALVRVVAVLLALAVAAPLAGCGKEKGQKTEVPQKTAVAGKAASPAGTPAGVPGGPQAAAPAPGGPQAAVPAPVGDQQVAGYVYLPEGRRDPFAPLVERADKKSTITKIGSPPLESHGVSDFKLTGVLTGGFGSQAILEGPDGKGYFVKLGTKVGPNGGIVTRITKDSLVVEERFKNYLGETVKKEIPLPLRKKQEGNP